MKHASWLIVLVVATVFGIEHIGGLRAAPPLTLSPELLSEGLPDAKKKEELAVDNTACYVCHGNMDGEELVISHGKEGTSCVDCHGPSLAHRNDEDNITPPDKMYTLADVDGMCHDCHDIHEASARDIIERWQDRCPEKTNPKQIACTDCHFHHRLAFRTVQWNKKTGELIVRRVKEETTSNEAEPAPAGDEMQ